MRNYLIDKKVPSRGSTNNTSRTLKNVKPKGLNLIHIGTDVWRIGKVSMVNNPDKDSSILKISHRVIYSPIGNKEYHLYGKDADKFEVVSTYDGDRYTDNGLVKIHILTNILDNADNWCFDLSKIPEIGKLKVIYENGTVRNIDFNGVFEPYIIKIVWKSTVKPIGYRKF